MTPIRAATLELREVLLELRDVRIHPGEAHIDLLVEVIQPLVGPSLSRRQTPQGPSAAIGITWMRSSRT